MLSLPQVQCFYDGWAALVATPRITAQLTEFTLGTAAWLRRLAAVAPPLDDAAAAAAAAVATSTPPPRPPATEDSVTVPGVSHDLNVEVFAASASSASSVEYFSRIPGRSHSPTACHPSTPFTQLLATRRT